MGEFKQTGNVIFINTGGDEQTAENVLEMLDPVIENHSLTVAGGGNGRIIIPSGRLCKQLPLLAGIVVTTVAEESFDPDLMMFLVYVKVPPKCLKKPLMPSKKPLPTKSMNCRSAKEWSCGNKCLS